MDSETEKSITRDRHSRTVQELGFGLYQVELKGEYRFDPTKQEFTDRITRCPDEELPVPVNQRRIEGLYCRSEQLGQGSLFLTTRSGQIEPVPLGIVSSVKRIKSLDELKGTA